MKALMLKGIRDLALMDVPVASVGPRDGPLGLRGALVPPGLVYIRSSAIPMSSMPATRSTRTGSPGR